MTSSMSLLQAETRRSELQRAARPSLTRRLLGPRKTVAAIRETPAVVVRRAFPDDEVALARLATLDGAPMPQLPALVAEVDGELWAAVSIDGSGAVADPFRPSGDLLLLLADHARRQARAARPSRRRARLLRPRLA